MIYLASRSPRRRELLAQINIRFQAVDVDIDETPQPDEAPDRFVLRMAEEKAAAAMQPSLQLPLLAADTSVVCDNRILGKPRDERDFTDMMHLLSGRQHQVLTAVAVTEPGGKTASRLSSSKVWFRSLNSADISAYWSTGEPRDKAGGYAVQGLAATFIQRIDGSYSGIMGLPLFETGELLAEFGVYCLA